MLITNCVSVTILFDENGNGLYHFLTGVSCSTAIFGGHCVNNQFEICHQVALLYQLCTNKEHINQSIGDIKVTCFPEIF